ncbi:MAG: sulfurtransferase complex subunit TusB [Methylococcaceae bacterium]|jgi:sulfur relay protein TusB/DsrH
MLHLISQPLEKQLLERIGADDAVVFMADAVLGILAQGVWAGDLQSLLRRNRLYVLAEDRLIRGIEKPELTQGIADIDYAGLVKLVCEHSVIQSWTL